MSFKCIYVAVREERFGDKKALSIYWTCAVGGIAAVRFFETEINLELDTPYHFVSSALSILVLAPVRLVREVARKIVYLPRKHIETMLTCAVTMGIGVTILDVLVQYYRGYLDVAVGRFPILLAVIGDCILVAIYTGFSMKKSVVYDNVEEVKKSEVTQEDTKQSAGVDEETAKPNESVTEEIIDGADDSELQALENWLKENDTFTAKINEDVLNLQDVKNYQNRLINGINEAELSASVQYDAQEVEHLRRQLAAVGTTSKFWNGKNLKNAMEGIRRDEAEVLRDEIVDVPEEFTLYGAAQ